MYTKKNSRSMRIMALMLALLMSCSLLVGCGEAPLPETTSTEADLYVYGAVICHADGSEAEGYTLDEDGNICDPDGNILVASANATAFTCVQQIALEDNSILKQELEATLLDDDQVAVKAKQFQVVLKVTADGPLTNTNVTLESSAPDILYFPLSANKALMVNDPVSVAEPTASPAADDGDGEFLDKITLVPDADGYVRAYAVAAFDGEARITARNVMGGEIADLGVTVTANVPEPSEDEDDEDKEGDEDDEDKEAEEKCEHSFTKKVVAPTTKAQGYTLYTCSKCGYSYRGNYTNKLNCNHVYTQKVVQPTYTTEGYTLYTCTLCGYSYTGDRTSKLTCDHSKTTDTVIKATCDSEGYTLHRCSICKSYEWRDNETPALGHQYDAGRVTVQPTCNTLGVRVFTCSRCGGTRTESINADNTKHNYVSTTTQATCIRDGRTTYTCTICGVQYVDRDSIVAPLGHDWGEWTVKTAATCGNAGVEVRTCKRDSSHTEERSIPATGEHNFVAGEVVAPTCETGGYTVYTCTGCGATEQRDQTQALGHNWEQKTEEVVVGTEVHTLCSDCQFDFSANGYTQAEVSDHTKEHLLAGGKGGYYSWPVEIKEMKTWYECSRCHATVDSIG